jgi:hypothetical protein
MVEWAAVNRLVAGSSPARGAKKFILNPELSDEVATKKLADRTPTAIDTVRSPIPLTVWG